MNLIETINSTIFHPQYAAHVNYVSDINPPSCGIVATLEYNERCAFVEGVEECHAHGRLGCIHLFYCTFGLESIFSEVLGMCFFVLVCAYMFFLSGTVANDFFCPSLKIISKILGMSETLAGVTLLAFGNSAADYFTVLTSLDSEVGLLFSEVTGSATFVTAMVGGLIISFGPFTLVGDLFARDCGFLIFSILIIDLAFITDGGVSITESAVILSLYIVYIAVVIADQLLVSYTKKKYANMYKKSVRLDEKFMRRMTVVHMQGELEVLSRRGVNSMSSGHTTSTASYAFDSPNSNLFYQLLYGINPIDKDEWNDGNFFNKFIMIIKIPGRFVLNLIVPKIDYDIALNGWSKLLNSIQVFIMPMVCFAVTVESENILYTFGFPTVLWIGIVTLPLGILVFFTSRTDVPPRYHPMFALLSILAAVDFIFLLAKEIVGVLSLFGIVMRASPSFLGCTILAWGNSIGDLIANVSLARQGYQKMGFAACFGGPLFNCMIGFGTIFLYKSWNSDDGVADMKQGSLGFTCVIFLAISLLAYWCALSLTDYVARRSIGLFMITLYCIFFLYALLTYLEVIHSYGTDHTEDLN